MPVVKQIPEGLKPFTCHGVDLTVTGSQARGECPFCGGEGKLYVNCESGLWECKVCLAKGNPIEFVRKLWEASDSSTTDYDELAEDRGLLYPETLSHWGVCKSIVSGDWLVPAYGADGKLCQVYRYVRARGEEKRALWATTGLGIGLYGMQFWDKKKETAYITEGPWDAMVLWEVLRSAKESLGGDGYSLTANEANSLYAGANILAVPGCGSFSEGWVDLFGGKTVVLLFDNDHPKEMEGGRIAEGGGLAGMKRVARMLTMANEPPLTVKYLRWGDNPTNHDEGLKSGFDLRDVLTGEE